MGSFESQVNEKKRRQNKALIGSFSLLLTVFVLVLVVEANRC